jgi:hypothetical protein
MLDLTSRPIIQSPICHTINHQVHRISHDSNSLCNAPVNSSNNQPYNPSLNSFNKYMVMGEHQITWINSFRYLGYQLSSKLSGGQIISTFECKIRQRVVIARWCSFDGTVFLKLRRVLFSTYVMSLFTWLYGIYPLFTDCQRDDFGDFYFMCLKRILGIPVSNDIVFVAIYKEVIRKLVLELLVYIQKSFNRVYKWIHSF